MSQFIPATPVRRGAWLRRDIQMRRRRIGPFVVSAVLMALCVVGVVLTAITLALNIRAGIFGFDFHGTIWSPDRAILRGQSPYPAADASALVRQGNPSIYPPPILLASLPLGLLPAGIAALAWSGVSLAALVLALVLLGLRDLRCYVLLLATPAVCAMVMLGQMEGLLALGCVVAWRWRNRAIIAGGAVAAVIAAKLFLAPLVLWLLVTRRYVAALIASLATLLACGVAWAIIGFDGLRAYPALLSANVQAFQAGGESLVALGTRFGLSAAHARPFAVLAGFGVLGLVIALAGRPDGDRRAFGAAVAAGIVLSPIVWLHYFVLVFLGLAHSRPRGGLVWAAISVTWITTTEHESTLRMAVTMVAIAAVLAATFSSTIGQPEDADTVNERHAWTPTSEPPGGRADLA